MSNTDTSSGSESSDVEYQPGDDLAELEALEELVKDMEVDDSSSDETDSSSAFVSSESDSDHFDEMDLLQGASQYTTRSGRTVRVPTRIVPTYNTHTGRHEIIGIRGNLAEIERKNRASDSWVAKEEADAEQDARLATVAMEIDEEEEDLYEYQTQSDTETETSDDPTSDSDSESEEEDPNDDRPKQDIGELLDCLKDEVDAIIGKEESEAESEEEEEEPVPVVNDLGLIVEDEEFNPEDYLVDSAEERDEAALDNVQEVDIGNLVVNHNATPGPKYYDKDGKEIQ